MLLKPDDPLRQDGLVYLDLSLAETPATHVLIVGVGDYRGGGLLPVTSPPASARELTSWFTDVARGRFKHPACPLGSVAVVLSEPGIASSTFGGGPVPRATFAGVERALQAWVDRINSHKGNLAFLYVACHGESSLSQTGILLEDFGTNRHKATAGMSEVGQLVNSLENAKAVQQLLLFDCCRTPTNLQLPFGTQFGTPFIVLQKAENDHGETRRQWVIFATSQGEDATGRRNRTTLFADSLIQCLDGAASDPADEDWPVRPGMLIDRLTRLLALHRLPNERLQAPSGRVTSTFTITHPGEPKDVPVYLSCEDPALWKGASLTLSSGGGDPIILEPKADETFAVVRLPPLTRLTAELAGTVKLPPVQLTLRGSAAFVEFKRQPAMTTVAVPSERHFSPVDGRFRHGALDALFDSGFEDGQPRLPWARDQSPPVLSVIARGPKTVAPAVTLEVASVGTEAGWHQSRVGSFNSPVEFTPPPGDYVVTARAPGAEPRSEQVAVEAGQRVTVDLAFPSSPHEWLLAATVLGVVDADALADEGPGRPRGRLPKIALGSTGQAVEVDLRARAMGRVRFDVGQPLSQLRVERRDIRVADAPLGYSSLRRPLFLSVRSGKRAELAVVPHTWATWANDGDWSVQFVLQRPSTHDDPLARVVVESERWVSLLGFLTKRDFVSANALLAVSEHVEALRRKLENPIVAAAAALVAVGLARPSEDEVWDPWLHNLSNWFPGLPDGPVILGRRLLTRARDARQIVEARKWLFEGFDRGAPVFSLSAEWLARSLESLPGDDPGLNARREAARGLVRRVDPTQPFTVIRTR